MLPVAIVDTGVANIASVRAAFDRLGASARSVSSPEAVSSAAAIVLPGVGAFGPAMERLDALRLVEPLRERIRSDRPTIAICLGMQLLCARSEESPGVTGVGVIDACVERLNGPRRTHFGWSAIDAPGNAVLEPGYAYFAHSYAMTRAPSGWTPTFANFGDRFISSLDRSNILACQFHPELSGAWGASLLERWLRRAAAAQEVATCNR